MAFGFFLPGRGEDLPFALDRLVFYALAVYILTRDRHSPIECTIICTIFVTVLLLSFDSDSVTRTKCFDMTSIMPMAYQTADVSQFQPRLCQRQLVQLIHSGPCGLSYPTIGVLSYAVFAGMIVKSGIKSNRAIVLIFLGISEHHLKRHGGTIKRRTAKRTKRTGTRAVRRSVLSHSGGVLRQQQ